MPPKTSPAVTRSKTPARQVTPAFAAAPAPQPQPEQVYAGLFGGGSVFGTNGNLSGSGYGTPTGTDQADARLESLEHPPDQLWTLGVP